MTIKKFVIYFVAFEALMYAVGYGLDIRLLRWIFWGSLVGGPVFVFPWVLKANEGKSDEQFESPVVWIALATIGFGVFFVLLALGGLTIRQGSADESLGFFLGSILVLIFSVTMLVSALGRGDEWRKMKASQKMVCPVCGIRVRHSRGICVSCGAIVFWVPSWMEDPDERGHLTP